MEYIIVNEVPSANIYCELRKKSGLSEKSIESVKLSLPNTIYGVSIMKDKTTVGMGRIIGDGYCFLQIVDIAVLPEHQKKGLGKLIMNYLMEFIKKNTNNDCYISLIADGSAKYLYEKFGFMTTYPKSIGMYYKHN